MSAGSTVSRLITSLERLDKASGEADRGATSLFRTLTTGVGIGIGSRALDGIASGFDSIKNAAIGLNSRLEQSKIAFTTMLGSGEKAQRFLDDLAKFAAKTPFEFPELQDAAKKMLAFGFEAKQIVPLLTSVGNAAAAMGSGAEGINNITRALGQMQAKGKVSAEEMLQLTEAGIPAWDMLAKKLGTDVAGAMDKVSKRTVDATTFITAFQEGVQTRFGDMMLQQSRTFEGAMSTIRDSLQMAVARGFRPLFDALSAGAQARAEFLQTDTVTQWADRFADMLRIVMDHLGTFRDGLGRLGATVLQVGGEIGTQLDQMFSPLIATVARLFGLGGGTGGSLGEQIGAFVASLPARIAGLPDAIGAELQRLPILTAGVLNTVAEAWNAHVGTINQVVGVWVPAVIEKFREVVDWIKAEWPTVQSTIATVFAAAQAAWATVLQPALVAALAKLGEVKDWVVGQWPLVQRTVETVFTAIRAAWDGPLQTALTAVLAKFTEVRGWVEGQWPTVQRVFESVTNALAAAWNGPLQQMFTALGQAFTTVRDWVTGNWSQVQSTFEQVANALAQAWNGPIQQMFTALGNAFTQVRDWVTQNWPTVQTKFAEVGSGIAETWTATIQPRLQALGDRFVAIKDWVVQNWPTVRSKFEEAGIGIQNSWATVIFPALNDLGTKLQGLKDYAIREWPGFQERATSVLGSIKQYVIDLNAELAKRGAYTDLTGAWQTIVEQVGPRLVATFGDVRKAAADAVAGDVPGAAGIKAVTSALREISKYIGPVLDTLGALVSGFHEVMKVASGFGTSIGATIRAILSIGSGNWQGAQAAINEATRGVQQYTEAVRNLGALKEGVFASWMNATAPPFGTPVGGSGTGLPGGGSTGGGTTLQNPGGGSTSGGGSTGGGGTGIRPIERVIVPPEITGSQDWRAVARGAAQQYGIDPSIFERQINQESSFAEDVIWGRRVSSAGARGIAQFMPATAAMVAGQLGVSVEQFWADPRIQLQGGALHMRDLLARYGGSWEKALVGYNAGPGNADRWVQAGGHLGWLTDGLAESREYIRAILGYQNGGLVSERVFGVGESGRGYVFHGSPDRPEAVLSAEDTQRLHDGTGRGEVHHHWNITLQGTPEEMVDTMVRRIKRIVRVDGPQALGLQP